jgi:hypothetical protein
MTIPKGAKGKTINLPSFDIRVMLTEPDPERPGLWLGGEITTSLREPAPHALRQLAEASDPESAEERENRLCYNAGIDAIEAMILAHACAGIDIESPAYEEAIEVAAQTLAANFS